MQDIGGRPQVILTVVYRCAITGVIVMCNRNQEEKNVFNMCIESVRISRGPAFAFARLHHRTGLLYRSDAPEPRIHLPDNLYTADLGLLGGKNRTHLRQLIPLSSNLQLSAGHVQLQGYRYDKTRRMSIKLKDQPVKCHRLQL